MHGAGEATLGVWCLHQEGRGWGHGWGDPNLGPEGKRGWDTLAHNYDNVATLIKTVVISIFELLIIIVLST